MLAGLRKQMAVQGLVVEQHVEKRKMQLESVDAEKKMKLIYLQTKKKTKFIKLIPVVIDCPD